MKQIAAREKKEFNEFVRKNLPQNNLPSRLLKEKEEVWVRVRTGIRVRITAILLKDVFSIT
jgi:hypothetical protein